MTRRFAGGEEGGGFFALLSPPGTKVELEDEGSEGSRVRVGVGVGDIESAVVGEGDERETEVVGGIELEFVGRDAKELVTSVGEGAGAVDNSELEVETVEGRLPDA